MDKYCCKTKCAYFNKSKQNQRRCPDNNQAVFKKILKFFFIPGSVMISNYRYDCFIKSYKKQRKDIPYIKNRPISTDSRLSGYLNQLLIIKHSHKALRQIFNHLGNSVAAGLCTYRQF